MVLRQVLQRHLNRISHSGYAQGILSPESTESTYALRLADPLLEAVLDAQARSQNDDLSHHFALSLFASLREDLWRHHEQVGIYAAHNRELPCVVEHFLNKYGDRQVQNNEVRDTRFASDAPFHVNFRKMLHVVVHEKDQMRPRLRELVSLLQAPPIQDPFLQRFRRDIFVDDPRIRSLTQLDAMVNAARYWEEPVSFDQSPRRSFNDDCSVHLPSLVQGLFSSTSAWCKAHASSSEGGVVAADC